jgi:hypothetical protein
LRKYPVSFAQDILKGKYPIEKLRYDRYWALRKLIYKLDTMGAKHHHELARALERYAEAHGL